MHKESLTALVRQHLAAATAATSGRSAHSIHGNREHVLRQTLIALRAGATLGEHESPGEATLQVLFGRVAVSAGEDRWEAAAGELLVLPASRHTLEAIEDSAVLLTVARAG